MKRQIINIDQELCDGCGNCIPNCKEGALQVIDGKARLISDLFCDGLGACIGHCPNGAITIEEREAEPYNERLVLEQIAKEPEAVLKAHLQHLVDHKAHEYYTEAKNYLKEHSMNNPLDTQNSKPANNTQIPEACGCQGSMIVDRRNGNHEHHETKTIDHRNRSQLKQWPVQLHLVRPEAPYFKEAELVIMSTCGPIASANVHEDYIRGRALVVACPKLDRTEPYVEKLAQIFSYNNTPKAIVVIMEVPCCKGLVKMVREAAAAAGMDNMIIEEHVLSLDGNLLSVNKYRVESGVVAS
jgi:ferredoxin